MILTTLGTLMAEMFEMCLHTGKFWAAAKKCEEVLSAWRGSAGSTSGKGFGEVVVVVPRRGRFLVLVVVVVAGGATSVPTVAAWSRRETLRNFIVGRRVIFSRGLTISETCFDF